MQTQRECTQFTHLCIYEYQVVRPWLSGDGWALIGTICTQLSSIIIHVNYNKLHMIITNYTYNRTQGGNGCILLLTGMHTGMYILI